MRNLIFFFLSFVVVIASVAQSVQTIRIKKNREVISTEKYSPIGLLQERVTILSINPNIEFKELFQYQGSLMVLSSNWLNAVNTADYEYSYDDKGNIVRIREKQNDSVTAVTYYEYDESFRVRESKSYAKDGRRTVITYIYNNNDQLAEELIVQMDSSEFMLRNVYIYGKEGLQDREIIIRNASDTSEVRVFRFDIKQQTKREWVLSGQDTLAEIRYFYKTNNKRVDRRLQQNSYSNSEQNGSQHIVKKLYLNPYGEIVRNERFKYNRFGRIRKEIYIDYRVYSTSDESKKTVLRYIYKYWKGSHPLFKHSYRAS